MWIVCFFPTVFMNIYEIMEVTEGLIKTLVVVRMCVGMRISPESRLE